MRHDIRTPLVGIIGSAHDIKKNINNHQKIDEVTESVEHLITSSVELFHLLNEILEIIKVASGDMPLTKKKFNLKEKLLHIIALNQATAYHKQLKLTLTYDDALPRYLIGDSIRIQRMILELVTNALNFTERGEINVITELAKRDGRNVIIKIRVADTGIGIPPLQQQAVFTRFKKLTPSCQGTYQGAGLGLSIVKQFIDDLQGEIYLQSKEQGTVFTCVLPLKEALLNEPCGADTTLITTPKQVYLAAKTKTTTSITKTFPESTHILLVEDNVIAAKVTKLLLNDLGCIVDIAHNEKTALQLVRKNNYDLIFLDIGLPDSSGICTAKQIREWEAVENKHIPILALTAHIDAENKTACLDAGMEEVLTKPLTRETAVSVLENFVTKECQLDTDKISS